MAEYPNGTPSWVELNAADMSAAADFYSQLFGWETAAFGVWEARSFTGAGLVNAPVSLCWSEVLTHDKAAVLDFYPAVFDWKATAPEFEASGDYTVWERPDGRGIGGAMQMSGEAFPAEMPAHWSVCFAVEDCDGTVAKATELGASVTMAPTDLPIGRFAGFVDPQGAAFTVMALSSAAGTAD